MKPKKKYKGTFNYHGEITTLYRWATSETAAKVLMYQAIQKLYGVSRGVIAGHFNGEKDNFKIMEVTKDVNPTSP